MVVWCGQRSSETWQHWTVPPCKGGTIGAAALLLIACTACWAAMRRIKLLSRHRGYLTVSTMGGLTLAAAVLLACSHLSWLVFLAVNHNSEVAAPFAMFMEVASFVSWAVTGVSCTGRFQPCLQPFILGVGRGCLGLCHLQMRAWHLLLQCINSSQACARAARHHDSSHCPAGSVPAWQAQRHAH